MASFGGKTDAAPVLCTGRHACNDTRRPCGRMRRNCVLPGQNYASAAAGVSSPPGSAAFASRYAFGDTPTRARKRRAK